MLTTPVSIAGISVTQSPTFKSNQFFVCVVGAGDVRTIGVDGMVAGSELDATPEPCAPQDGSNANAVSDAHSVAALLVGRILEKLRGDRLRIVVVVDVAGEALDDQVGDDAHRMSAYPLRVPLTLAFSEIVRSLTST